MLNFNGEFQLNTNLPCGDKSISHRALIFAALANGKSTVRNLSTCADVLSTAECLSALGATIKLTGTTAEVTPIAEPNDNTVLNCGNSGTTARLLAGVVAGLGVSATFVGDKSLSRRPMGRVTTPLSLLGAQFSQPQGALFRVEKSALVGRKIVGEVNSAQVKSAVLLAGLFAKGATTYTEKIATRNHTELLMEHCGVGISAQGNSITVVGGGKLQAFDLTVPNDPSSVAYLVALVFATGQQATFQNVLLNPLRNGFVDVLARSGANVYARNKRTVCGELVGDLVVDGGCLAPIVATTVDVCNAIDEIPLLAALGVIAGGKHVFCGVDELRHKECDRVQAICHFAHVCGGSATVADDVLMVVSNGVLPHKPYFCTFDDHRIAMCCSVLCLACGGGAIDSQPFEVSFPNFLQALGVAPLRFALVGNNVAHSKSPLLMSVLARNANVCCSYDLVDLPTDVADGKLLEVIRSFDGANVTMPFKSRVATLLGAQMPVNTVGKNIVPCSTDGIGVVAALKNNRLPLDGKMLVVGAGGSAQSVIFELTKLGVPVAVVNRTQQKVAVLQQKYPILADTSNPVGVLSFVPNCPTESQLPLPPSVRFVLVARYDGENPLTTRAKQRGITVVDGLQMLYHQGASSFSLWTGTQVQNNYQQFFEELQK